MKQYGIKVHKSDQALINITCKSPDAMEAFAFRDTLDGKVQVFTQNKNRLELWIKDLKEAKRPYELIET